MSRYHKYDAGKLAAYGIQDEEKKGQNPISVGHC
jgi:hypothetical protein